LGERRRSQASAACTGVMPSSAATPPVGAVAAHGDGEERQKGDAVLRSVVEDVLVIAGRQVVEVLHGGDRGGAPRFLQLLDGHLGQADVPDLPLLLQLCQRAHLIGDGVGGVETVQMQQVDPVRAQAAQTQLGLLA